MKAVNREVINLDMDGILADFNRYALRLYNELHGTKFDENKCNEYIGDHEVLNPEIDAKALRKPFKDPGFFISLPVIPGAQAAVKQLNEDFDLYVVTTQYYGNPTCVHEKHVWLQRHFPEIADKGIFTKHKYRVNGSMLVDDRPSILAKWQEHNMDGATASLTYPWTDDFIVDVHAPTWDELTKKIYQHFGK